MENILKTSPLRFALAQPIKEFLLFPFQPEKEGLDKTFYIISKQYGIA